MLESHKTLRRPLLILSCIVMLCALGFNGRAAITPDNPQSTTENTAKGSMSITSLTSDTIYPGDPVTVQATVRDKDGNAASGVSVSFKVDGTSIGSGTTDSAGHASASWTGSGSGSVGPHTATASVDASKYDPSSDSKSFSVTAPSIIQFNKNNVNSDFPACQNSNIDLSNFVIKTIPTRFQNTITLKSLTKNNWTTTLGSHTVKIYITGYPGTVKSATYSVRGHVWYPYSTYAKFQAGADADLPQPVSDQDSGTIPTTIPFVTAWQTLTEVTSFTAEKQAEAKNSQGNASITLDGAHTTSTTFTGDLGFSYEGVSVGFSATWCTSNTYGTSATYGDQNDSRGWWAVLYQQFAKSTIEQKIYSSKGGALREDTFYTKGPEPMNSFIHKASSICN